MNKQDIIARMSPEIYAIECEDARAAAPFTGRSDATQVYASDAPHQIDTWIWETENDLSATEKVRLMFAIYRDMPCYALLMLNGVRYDRFAEETKAIFWDAVRGLLAADDDALAQPLMYMLWCDFFELCQDCDAWHRLVTRDAHPRLLHRMLEISGPVPFHLKEVLYRRLITDVSWHPAIYTSLRSSYYDLYGQIDKNKAHQLLEQLVLAAESKEQQKFRSALAQGDRHSNWHTEVRRGQCNQ